MQYEGQNRIPLDSLSLKNIFLRLPDKDLINQCQTSKDMREICKHQDLWKERLELYYPTRVMYNPDFISWMDYYIIVSILRSDAVVYNKLGKYIYSMTMKTGKLDQELATALVGFLNAETITNLIRDNPIEHISNSEEYIANMLKVYLTINYDDKDNTDFALTIAPDTPAMHDLLYLSTPKFLEEYLGNIDTDAGHLFYTNLHEGLSPKQAMAFIRAGNLFNNDIFRFLIKDSFESANLYINELIRRGVTVEEISATLNNFLTDFRFLEQDPDEEENYIHIDMEEWLYILEFMHKRNTPLDYPKLFDALHAKPDLGPGDVSKQMIHHALNLGYIPTKEDLKPVVDRNHFLHEIMKGLLKRRGLEYLL